MIIYAFFENLQDDSLPERSRRRSFFLVLNAVVHSPSTRGCSGSIAPRSRHRIHPSGNKSGVRARSLLTQHSRNDQNSFFLTFMSEHRSIHSILHVESTLHAHSIKKKGEKHKWRQEIKHWSKDAFGTLKQSFVDIHLVSSTKFRCIDWMREEEKERKEGEGWMRMEGSDRRCYI